MTWKFLVPAIFLSVFVSPAYADPSLSVIPQGVQSGNWVWEVDITPDLALAGGSTPVNFELGFRLTGAPLLSATNINPSKFDSNLPGNVIFGWETLYGGPPFPEGLEINCTGCTATNAAPFGGHAATVVTGTANEIFAAMGSVDFTTPGPKPFLQIVTLGPTSGYPSSTIQWLGAYGGNGRIFQIGGTFNFAGTDTQLIPEPASVVLLAFGAIVFMFGNTGTRRSPRAIPS